MSHPTLKLGNRTLIHTKPALSLSDFFTGVLPATPPVDYLTYRTRWPWWLNNQYGTCVAATWAGVLALVTFYLTGGEVILTDADIEAIYKTQNPNFPAEDNGMDIQKLLEYLQQTGKIAAFGTVAKSQHDAGISIFGFEWTSIAVRASFYDDYNAGRPIRYVPSSTLEGYHSVMSAGHRDTAADDVRFETWTRECGFTQAFWNSSDVGTTWAVILPEHLKSKEFMAAMDIPALAAAFKTLTGRDLPMPTVMDFKPTPGATCDVLAGGAAYKTIDGSGGVWPTPVATKGVPHLGTQTRSDGIKGSWVVLPSGLAWGVNVTNVVTPPVGPNPPDYLAHVSETNGVLTITPA
jgi:hypothetical protein